VRVRVSERVRERVSERVRERERERKRERERERERGEREREREREKTLLYHGNKRRISRPCCKAHLYSHIFLQVQNPWCADM